MFQDRFYFILVCFFAIFWQWKQPALDTKYYSQLAWQYRRQHHSYSPVTTTDALKTSEHQPLLGMTVVITGVTSGLGLGIAKNLYRMGATIIAVGRSSTKLDSVKTLLLSIDMPPTSSSSSSSTSVNTTNDVSSSSTNNNPNSRVYVFVADFTDLNSVSKAADAIKSQFSSIDFLINNAGMYHAATTDIATQQGYEIVFGVNYLAHFLWTYKLLPLLHFVHDSQGDDKKDKGTVRIQQQKQQRRIIQISSTMHGAVDGNDLYSLDYVHHPPIASIPLNTTIQKSRSYSNSKLAQIYHTRALNRHLMSQKHSCPSLVDDLNNNNSSSSSRGGGIQPPASCVHVVNVCPSWVGTSISASNFAEFIMKQLGYEADGFGVASTLHAMFYPMTTTTNTTSSLDYVSNNKNFASMVRFATKVLGKYPWLDSSNIRVKIWTTISLLLLMIEKFIPDTGFVETSEESYNVTKQDALYVWSLQAIQPFV